MEYWLTPDGKATRPFASAPLRVDSKSTIDTDSIRASWEQRIPGLHQKPLEQQEVLMRSYIKSNFVYDYNPLDYEFNASKEGLGEYTNRVLEGKEANCNVANTSVASSFVDATEGRATVAPVDGFSNRAGPGENVLTSHELHMWNTDWRGSVLDSTPSKVEVMSVPPKKGLTWPIGLLLGGTVVAGVALNMRRIRRTVDTVSEKVDKLSRDYHIRQLYSPQTQNFDVTRKVVEAVLYDRRQDVAGAVNRAQTGPVELSSLEAITQAPHLMSDATVQSVAAQAKAASSPAERDILQGAHRTLRHLNKIVKRNGSVSL